MCPSLVDPELETKHVSGKLVLVLTKHVDDVKAGGKPAFTAPGEDARAGVRPAGGHHGDLRG
jgi:hypothetical protein